MRAQMRIEIGTLQRGSIKTMSRKHDQVEAMTLGDGRRAVEGRIQQIGRPIDIYRAPANRFVAGFIGTPRMNFVEGHVQREGRKLVFVSNGARVELNPDRSTPQEVTEPTTLGVRPEDLTMDSEGAAGNTLTGRVVLVERLGGTTHVHFDAGAHRLMAAIADDARSEGVAKMTLEVNW